MKTRKTRFARLLRRRMTDTERRLWTHLRSNRLAGAKFRRQIPVGPYIADFICFAAYLVIEVDGGQHLHCASDARRDRWFAERGYRVLRFWDNEIWENLPGVLETILASLPPHPPRCARPPSLSRGEGKNRNPSPLEGEGQG